MHELWRAVVSDKESNAAVSKTFQPFTIQESRWNAMRCPQKEAVLATFALPLEMAEKDSPIPRWLRKGEKKYGMH